uniref:Uncharacterized protein n=1 Tax=Mycena chlorophos TaxID=658473 RepID=A0ABQ0M054_MYCCL|nr:predicted protein [Mycena chlorophos]
MQRTVAPCSVRTRWKLHNVGHGKAPTGSHRSSRCSTQCAAPPPMLLEEELKRKECPRVVNDSDFHPRLRVGTMERALMRYRSSSSKLRSLRRQAAWRGRIYCSSSGSARTSSAATNVSANKKHRTPPKNEKVLICYRNANLTLNAVWKRWWPLIDQPQMRQREAAHFRRRKPRRPFATLPEIVMTAKILERSASNHCWSKSSARIQALVAKITSMNMNSPLLLCDRETIYGIQNQFVIQIACLLESASAFRDLLAIAVRAARLTDDEWARFLAFHDLRRLRELAVAGLAEEEWRSLLAFRDLLGLAVQLAGLADDEWRRATAFHEFRRLRSAVAGLADDEWHSWARELFAIDLHADPWKVEGAHENNAEENGEHRRDSLLHLLYMVESHCCVRPNCQLTRIWTCFPTLATQALCRGGSLAQPDDSSRGLVSLPLQVAPAAMNFSWTDRYSIEADEEWASLIPYGHGWVRLGVEKEAFAVSMYHQLHCLNGIRTALLIPREGHTPQLESHTNHCFNYLRQLLLCKLDTTLEPTIIAPAGEGKVKASASGENVVHICRDWAQVRRFVENNMRVAHGLSPEEDVNVEQDL